MSIGAGASGQLALRSVGAEGDDQLTLQNATVAPGVAPWVSGRLGIRGSNEAGLTYTARTARLDARHAFDFDGPAISVGLGGSVVLPHPNRGDAVHNLYGGGLDVPVLFGTRTRSDLYAVWIGPRGGFEVVRGQLPGPPAADPAAPEAAPRDVDARHFQVGLVAGMRAGFRHLHVAIELDAAYHYAEGSFGDVDASIDQVTLTPAGALVLTF